MHHQNNQVVPDPTCPPAADLLLLWCPSNGSTRWWWSCFRWSGMWRTHLVINQLKQVHVISLLVEIHWLPAFSSSPLFWAREHQLDLLLLLVCCVPHMSIILQCCWFRQTSPDSSHPLFPNGTTSKALSELEQPSLPSQSSWKHRSSESSCSPHSASLSPPLFSFYPLHGSALVVELGSLGLWGATLHWSQLHSERCLSLKATMFV